MAIVTLFVIFGEYNLLNFFLAWLAQFYKTLLAQTFILITNTHFLILLIIIFCNIA